MQEVGQHEVDQDDGRVDGQEDGPEKGQEEGGALFASARAGAASDLRNGRSEGQTGAGKSYNFSRAGQISKEQLKAIATVNDIFARNLSHNLGAWLRTHFQAVVTLAEQTLYADFVGRMPELRYVCSVRLEPLDALGVLQFDLALAPPIVDLLLGGVGRAGTQRELTDIEEEIVLSVMEIVVRELNVAWQPVGLKFALEKREMAAQISRLMASAEKALAVEFEIHMPHVTGSLKMCLPTVVLNTILRRMISERDRPRRRSAAALARMHELMGEARYAAVLQFDSMRLNARDLADVAPGKLLRLPLPRDATAELRIGGLPVFRAQPVRSGEHRGAQVRGHSADASRPIA